MQKCRCTHTHTHTRFPPPSSPIRLPYQKRKGREGGGWSPCDNGFHQIPPLSQIKMPAWRALAIFLFICLLIFFFSLSASAIGFLGQSIVTGLPNIQGEVNLNLIGHCLILPIADSCSWYWSQSCPPHISSHLLEWGSMFVPVSVSLVEDAVAVSSWNSLSTMGKYPN